MFRYFSLNFVVTKDSNIIIVYTDAKVSALSGDTVKFFESVAEQNREDLHVTVKRRNNLNLLLATVNRSNEPLHKDGETQS
jgi:hypothetical protein